MPNKIIRSLRHLKRSVADNTPQTLLIYGARGVHKINFIKFVDGEYSRCYFFTNRLGMSGLSLEEVLNDNPSAKSIRLKLEELLMNNSCYSCNDSCTLYQFGSNIILLDDNIENEYEDFKQRNKKILNPLFSNFFSSTDNIGLYFFILSNGSPNYFEWIAKNYFKSSIPASIFENIFTWLKRYGKLANQLKKGTITAYNGSSNIIGMIYEMNNIRRTKRASSVISSFNTQQKHLLKEVTLTPRIVAMMSKFARLSETKRKNFIRKMSTVTDVNEIFHQMELITHAQFVWDFNAFLDFATNGDDIKCHIIMAKDNIVLLRVDDYDSIKYLAKTTNWCISKNKSYWNNYLRDTDNKSQFIVYNFNLKEDDDLSIIGFTLDKKYKAITAAHSFTNRNLLNERNRQREHGNCGDLISFIDTKVEASIHKILKDWNITINSLIDPISLPYAFNRGAFMEYFLNKAENIPYTFFVENDNEIILSTNKVGVEMIIGSRPQRPRGPFMHYEPISPRMPSNDSTNNALFDAEKVNETVLVFINFKEELTNPEIIQFVTVYENRERNEHYTDAVCDINGSCSSSSFDKLLFQYDLPYDLIKRPIIKSQMFTRYLLDWNLMAAQKMLDNGAYNPKQLKIDSSRPLERSVSSSLFNHMSLTFLEFIYRNKLSLYDFMTKKGVNQFIGGVIRHIAEYIPSDTFELTDEVWKSFEKGDIQDIRTKLCLGYSKALIMVLNNETFHSGPITSIQEFGRISNINMLKIFLEPLIRQMTQAPLSDFNTKVFAQICRYGELFDMYYEMQTPTRELMEYGLQYALFHFKSPRLTSVLENLKLNQKKTTESKDTLNWHSISDLYNSFSIGHV